MNSKFIKDIYRPYLYIFFRTCVRVSVQDETEDSFELYNRANGVSNRSCVRICAHVHNIHKRA